MQMVNVFKAVPGMILAQSVKNKDGRHLMEKGTVLREKEIRILRMWGVLDVAVRTGSPGAGEVTEAIRNPEISTFMDSWFGNNNPEKEPVKTLYELCGEWFESDPKAFARLQERLEAFSRKKTETIPSGTFASPEALLADTVKLPALPRIYSEITAAVNDPKCSGKEIAEIVSKDTGLSATLLKLVNSAFYAGTEKVDSLQYAAMALGTRQICSLAMGITVINHFKGLPESILDMSAFWRHSLGSAIAARNLAVHVPKVSQDRVFIGGLLHDMGRLIFCSYFPEAANAALSKAARLRLPLDKTEPMFFRMSHAEFGSRLAESWLFSPEVTALIRNHHADDGCEMDCESAVVYFANWLASALGIGFSGELVLPRLNTRVWELLGISSSAMIPVVRQTERQLKEAIRFFYE